MTTPEEWAKVCGHVDKVVAKYMKTEHLLDEASEEFNFVVNTGDSDHEFTDLSDDENDGNISGVDTAKCLGVSRLSVSQYKDGSNATKIQRKRLTKSSTDENANIKKEIRLAIYQMYNDSKTVVTLLLIDGKQQFVEFMQNFL
jgi:hypothetical protein